MKSLLRIYGKMIIMAGGLLGLVAGCQPAEYGPGSGTYRDDDLQPEYGAPMATYRVIGQVYDNQDSSALKGIMLTSTSANGEQSTDTSTANGTYELKGYSAGSGELTISLCDADTTDGLHESKSVIISLQYTGGDGNWDEGHAEAGKDIYLKRIEK